MEINIEAYVTKKSIPKEFCVEIYLAPILFLAPSSIDPAQGLNRKNTVL